jgi:hypothetical protein
MIFERINLRSRSNKKYNLAPLYFDGGIHWGAINIEKNTKAGYILQNIVDRRPGCVKKHLF